MAGKKASGTSNQATAKSKKPKKRESSGHRANNTEYFAFLNESQKRDHDFFERLAEKEGERELKSQEMMFAMVKEVAKIFKGQ